MRLLHQRIILLVTPVVFVTMSDNVPAQTLQGDRRLGIDLNEAEGVTYDDAVEAAKSVGAQSASISLNWDQIEPKPNMFVDPGGVLFLIDTYYPAQGLSVDLYLRCVDTDGRHVPSDLDQVPFDHRAMIARFRKLLDFVFSRIPNVTLNIVSIGNELTLAFPAQDRFWKEYETFYRRAVDHVHRIKRGTTIGAVGTLYEVVGSHRQVMQRLNRHSDVILISYYPLNADFSVKPSADVEKDFSQLVQLYRKRTICFSETGYPSSERLGSSERKQRQFVEAVFSAWDQHAAQIRYISFAWLHDQPDSQLDEFERYYGSSHPDFRAYLGTLGLRRRNGQAKAAFEAIREQTRVRHWKAKQFNRTRR